MSALQVWLPKNFLDLIPKRVNWREVVGVLSLSLVGRLLWGQYGVLRRPKLPPLDLGLPVLGHTPAIVRETFEVVGNRLLKGKRTVLANFQGANIVLVDWPLYMERLHRLELDGALVPGWPTTMKSMLGPNSILSLPGGKGHSRHKRLRSKILASLGPKAVLGFLPEIIGLVRETLDAMASETQSQGSCSFAKHASALAGEASTLPITAGLEAETQKEMSPLLDDVMSAVMTLPINLGRLTRYGRGLIARERLGVIVRTLMESPNLSRRSIIGDLVQASEDGEGFQPDEMVDTVVSLLLAGRLTTAEALPTVLAFLHDHRDWAQRIACEPLEFQGCEVDSDTLRFVRETLRVQPPVGAIRRSLIDKTQAIDLGEDGSVPLGTPFMAYFRKELSEMADGFDPERWTPELAREKFIVFGGHQPHQCIGKNLALLELQVFARVLCAEYEFEVLDTSRVAQAPFFAKGYKDGLRVKVARKGA